MKCLIYTGNKNPGFTDVKDRWSKQSSTNTTNVMQSTKRSLTPDALRCGALSCGLLRCVAVSCRAAPRSKKTRAVLRLVKVCNAAWCGIILRHVASGAVAVSYGAARYRTSPQRIRCERVLRDWSRRRHEARTAAQHRRQFSADWLPAVTRLTTSYGAQASFKCDIEILQQLNDYYRSLCRKQSTHRLASTAQKHRIYVSHNIDSIEFYKSKKTYSKDGLNLSFNNIYCSVKSDFCLCEVLKIFNLNSVHHTKKVCDTTFWKLQK